MNEAKLFYNNFLKLVPFVHCLWKLEQFKYRGLGHFKRKLQVERDISH